MGSNSRSVQGIGVKRILTISLDEFGDEVMKRMLLIGNDLKLANRFIAAVRKIFLSLIERAQIRDYCRAAINTVDLFIEELKEQELAEEVKIYELLDELMSFFCQELQIPRRLM